MPTSKLPSEDALVPMSIIELSRTHPEVLCNLRLMQSPLPADRVERAKFLVSLSEDYCLHPSVMKFLKGLNLSQPRKMVLLFQGYRVEQIGTAVILLRTVFEGYSCIRLDFEHPPTMNDILVCSNFWSAFILALFLLPPECGIEIGCRRGESWFIELAAQNTREIRDCRNNPLALEALREVRFPACSRFCGHLLSHGYRECEKACPGKPVDLVSYLE